MRKKALVNGRDRQPTRRGNDEQGSAKARRDPGRELDQVAGGGLLAGRGGLPAAGKPNGAEKNDASAWLPASSESVKVLDVQTHLDVGRWMWWPSKLARTPDPAPAELSHERASALTRV